MAKRIVAGNWKTYIESRSDARAFALALRRKARSLSGVDVFIAPPFILLPELEEVLRSSPIKVGAQGVSPYTAGAHTGDVSAAMLKDAGALFAIIGHSEERAAGTTNEMVRGSLERAVEKNIIPILCIGERERESEGEHFDFIEAQLTTAFKHFPGKLTKLIIAYEPVWAIGKKAEEAMGPQELHQMSIFIRKVLTEIMGRTQALKVPVLYGGSVDETNAQLLLQEGGVAGFLLGRASTDIDTFLTIINICRR